MADKWPIGMNDADLMRVMGINKSLFGRLKKAGTFDGLRVKPQLTKTVQYSGERVARWTSGVGDWVARRAS